MLGGGAAIAADGRVMPSQVPVARLLPVDRDARDLETLGIAARILTTGGVVAYPTDTLYGLAADPRDSAAVDRLLDAKRRPPGLAIPLIASDPVQAEDAAGALTPLARLLMGAFWPGPLALVVDAAASLDPRIVGEGGTIAVRVPANAVACALARLFDYPITATSANRSGGPAPASAADAGAAFGADIDAVIDAGPTPGGAPSTIVDARGDAPRLVREGAVPWARVLQSIA